MEGNKPLFDFRIDEEGKEELTELARWTKFQSIAVLTMIVLVILFFLFAWNRLGAAFSTVDGDEARSLVLILAVIVLVIGTVIGLMMYFLLRSSNRIRTAIQMQDRQLLNKGLNDLRIYFAIFGVISILALFSNLISLL